MNMERKFYPRITTHLPLIVNNDEGVQLKVLALNLSIEGFSFQCSTLQRNMITPGGCYIGSNGRPIELDASIELPLTGHSFQINARCHVAFSRRVSSERCEIGARYLELEGDGYRDLLRFIENSMASNDLLTPAGSKQATLEVSHEKHV